MSDAQAIDWLVVTAANREQAKGYRAQLAARERDGRLRGVNKWMVVADPGDRRVGSGGSTFVVLHELARRIAGTGPQAPKPTMRNLFQGKRILVVHSGGDSRRLPAYAAEGKAFVPLPREMEDGHAATLFDLVLKDLASLVLPGHVVVATGDVHLGIGSLAPELGAAGIVGVAYPGAMEVGSRHGVYVQGAGGRVKDFVQKPSREEAQRCGAVDARGRVLIDTGVLSLDAATVAQWVRASAQMVKAIEARRAMVVDLYSDVLPGIAGRGDSQWRGFRATFHVAVVPRCDFLHIGSTRELVEIVARDPRVRRQGMARGTAVFNSVVSAKLTAGPGSIVESCRVDRALRIGRGGVLVGFPGGERLRIDDRRGMAFLPVGAREWACVVFGQRDDFKTSWRRGGTIGNETIERWMERVGVRESEVFGDGDDTLWSARVWIVGELSEVVNGSRWMAIPGGRPTAEWRRARRVSLAALIPRVNVRRLLAHRADLQREEMIGRWAKEIADGRVPPTALMMQTVRTAGEASRVGDAVRRRLKREIRPFVRARLFNAATAINRRFFGLSGNARPGDLDAPAFESVAEGVAASSGQRTTRSRAAIRTGQVVRASCPVRVDLAGGWSDTPPICHEMGGTVLNAAISLDGSRPVEAIAQLLDEPIVRIRSEDLGKSVTITRTSELLSHRNPSDWAALVKAALVLSGIVPRNSREHLARRLRTFGGGLEITMSAAVPKGSGLGTSSILGATVLACLDQVCGRRSGVRSLIERTSVLEQMMSTAGGWQDQAGGLTPGIKILRTPPGPAQVPDVSRLPVPQAALRELRDRSILFYTGQRRLARDILQGVVRRYISGDQRMVEIVNELKENAEEAARSLAQGDMDALARGVLRNWELKKEIDPGSTNARIEKILRALAPRLAGYSLAGAGGGGFIFMIAKTARDAGGVRRMLSRRRGGARIVEFEIDQRGLEVQVWQCGPRGVIVKGA